MKKYQFDKIIDRRGSNSDKWDIDKAEDDIIPLWVADMDFAVAPKITEALKRRVEHPIYGYTLVPESFYEAICSWHKRRSGWVVEKDWILYTTGVVPAVSAIIKALASGEKRGVVLQTPAYNCFFSSIKNNGCEVIESPLKRVGDTYEVDYEEFEAAVAREDVALFLLCNPHNPSGRVWTEEELRKMGDICLRHGVTVVADEIHSGIVMPGYKYTPYASLGKEYQDGSVTTLSSSKSFNTAGLAISYIISDNESVRQKINRAININEVCDVNPFGVVALEVAYNECEDWLEEMCEYVWENYEYLRETLREQLPEATVIKLEGTYLAWVDCRWTRKTSAEIGRQLLKEGRVRVSPGNIYGEPSGYIRINLACPRETLSGGLRRIVEVMQKWGH